MRFAAALIALATAGHLALPPAANAAAIALQAGTYQLTGPVTSSLGLCPFAANQIVNATLVYAGTASATGNTLYMPVISQPAGGTPSAQQLQMYLPSAMVTGPGAWSGRLAVEIIPGNVPGVIYRGAFSAAFAAGDNHSLSGSFTFVALQGTCSFQVVGARTN